MRKIIAAIQTSLDGYVEGPNCELDWVTTWEDPFDLLGAIDTCILGAGMYPGYAQYWRAILADPKARLEFTGRPPTEGEIEYAHFADRTSHLVLSTTMIGAEWSNTRVVRDVSAIRALKAVPGRDMHAVGGAALIRSLLDAQLVDELRLVVHPVLLGQGKPLFNGVGERRDLELLWTRRVDGSSALAVAYRVAAHA
jgi:dihydrofolate reductase